MPTRILIVEDDLNLAILLQYNLEAAGYEVEVLTSAYRGGGGDSYEGIPLHRFRYFPARWENLTHDEAASDRMRRSLIYRVLPLFYIAGGLWASWRLAKWRADRPANPPNNVQTRWSCR